MSDGRDRAPAGPQPEALYSVQSMVRLTGVDGARLRRWARSGLLPPRRREGQKLWYGFPDVVAARTAQGLLAQGVRIRQVREAVEIVRAWRPDLSHPIAALRVERDGGRLVVKVDDALLEPRSGQALMDLRVAPLAEAAAAEAQVLTLNLRPPSAETWRQRAAAAEARGEVEAALTAYQRALDVEPDDVAALIAQGNLRFAAGELEVARDLYRRATAADPASAEAWYNLANTWDDLGQPDAAVRAYETALRFAPDFADAHFNLGLCWEKLGARDRARPHWASYLALQPEGSSADLARRFLTSDAE